MRDSVAQTQRILRGSISSHAFYAVASMQAAARSRAHDAQLSFAQLFARRPFYFIPLYAPSLLVRKGPTAIQELARRQRSRTER
jgi:hypothetical protein